MKKMVLLFLTILSVGHSAESKAEVVEWIAGEQTSAEGCHRKMKLLNHFLPELKIVGHADCVQNLLRVRYSGSVEKGQGEVRISNDSLRFSGWRPMFHADSYRVLRQFLGDIGVIAQELRPIFASDSSYGDDFDFKIKWTADPLMAREQVTSDCTLFVYRRVQLNEIIQVLMDKGYDIVDSTKNQFWIHLDGRIKVGESFVVFKEYRNGSDSTLTGLHEPILEYSTGLGMAIKTKVIRNDKLINKHLFATSVSREEGEDRYEFYDRFVQKIADELPECGDTESP